MRSQFISGKDGFDTGTTGDLDVQVQIEQAVMVDYDCSREDYRVPRVIGDRKQNATKEDVERPSAERNQWELSNVKTAEAV